MYRELNRVDTLSASQSLRRLRDAGLLEQKGRGAGTYYSPTPWLLGGDGEAGASSDNRTQPSDLESLPSQSEALPSNLAVLSRNSHWQALPSNLQDTVVALGQRASTDRVREALIQLCKHRSWQASELAGLFNRNADYLGTQYLRPLVSAGVLSYTWPDQPNHPHQAYRAVDGDDKENNSTNRKCDASVTCTTTHSGTS